MGESTYFSNLYQYATERGVVIPETSKIRDDVESWMREVVFPGKNIDLTASTAIGRIVEALTFLFVDVLGINAQNANGLNPSVTVGDALDAVGKLFGIEREDGESDEQLRNRILGSQSTGIGFVQSIRNAVSKVTGVRSVCVLENGSGFPRFVSGIALAPHSIFVCIGKDNPTEPPSEDMKLGVAEAIRKTKSCGCAFTNTTEYGTPYSYEFRVGDKILSRIYFYVAQKINVKVSISAKVISTRIIPQQTVIDNVREIVKATMNGAEIPSIITEDEITSAIAVNGGGIVSTKTIITIDGVAVEQIEILPNRFIGMEDSDIEVSVI